MGLPWKRAATRDRPSTNRHRMECIRILCSLIELDGSEKAREGTACRSGKFAEEEHNNDAVQTFVGDRVR